MNDPNEGQPTEVETTTTVGEDANGQDVEKQEQEQEESYLSRLSEAAGNLAPSEIPTADQVPALLGVLLFAQDNGGDLPGPLHERFPDHYPDPDNN